MPPDASAWASSSLAISTFFVLLPFRVAAVRPLLFAPPPFVECLLWPPPSFSFLAGGAVLRTPSPSAAVPVVLNLLWFKRLEHWFGLGGPAKSKFLAFSSTPMFRFRP